MARTDDDSWDIATSVGATAVIVAMARAEATNSAEPLIRDQFAEPLVSTPALAELRGHVMTWIESGEGGADQRAVDYQRLVSFMTVRTHFFDAFFTDAAAAGIGQHVILASGLDSRAYRLGWPQGSVVYEIDLPAVLDYKRATLKDVGATPTTERREVAVDLRQDWPAALRRAGFDPTLATAWLAEGLLPYLPTAATEALFDNIGRHSAAGSRVAVSQFDMRRHDVERHLGKVRAAHEYTQDEIPIDPSELWYSEQGRPNAAEWFGSRGWTTHSTDSREEAKRVGLQVPEPEHQRSVYDPFFNNFITAQSAAGP